MIEGSLKSMMGTGRTGADRRDDDWRGRVVGQGEEVARKDRLRRARWAVSFEVAIAGPQHGLTLRSKADTKRKKEGEWVARREEQMPLFTRPLSCSQSSPLRSTAVESPSLSNGWDVLLGQPEVIGRLCAQVSTRIGDKTESAQLLKVRRRRQSPARSRARVVSKA